MSLYLHMYMGWGTISRSQFSFYHMDLRRQTEVLRLGGKLLSHRAISLVHILTLNENDCFPFLGFVVMFVKLYTAPPPRFKTLWPSFILAISSSIFENYEIFTFIFNVYAC